MADRDLSFASFNLLNLQLPGEPWRGHSYTPAQYQEKLAWSAAAIQTLDADVIAFQELWSKRCLLELFDLAGLGEYKLFFIDDRWYDIAVAAAVRRPWSVRALQVHKAFPAECALRKRRRAPVPTAAGFEAEDDEVELKIDRFSRAVLQLDLHHESDLTPDVRVFAAHLKSKLATRLDAEEYDQEPIRVHAPALGTALSTIRRTAEAAALRVLLTNSTRGTATPVACIGDLNDGIESNTLAILTGEPSMRLNAKSRMGLRSDAGLYSAARLQQLHSFRDVYYSHNYSGILETLDHILVSEQFYDHSKQRIWSLDRLRMWNDHLDGKSRACSDHGLVAAYFSYHPA